MSRILEIPEIRLIDSKTSLIRIPAEIDVPVTSRVCRLIDTAEFQRLKSISQLGFVSLVYPAANHTRFEHSLGVYRLALLYLKRLAHDPQFAKLIDKQDAELLIVTALLHDLGHWPFCHAIEDIQLPRVPRHEFFASSFLLEGEIAELLVHDWDIHARDVAGLLGSESQQASHQILASMLSGPIDIDKMDYLPRDSLHAGVPYGRNFDEQRLIGSLCLNAEGTALAIGEKGKTAAEMMVFARYVMFSEVYWHHAVRGATAMLQRGFYHIFESMDLDILFRASETSMIHELRVAAEGTPAAPLFEGLFGPRRRLYKRLRQFSLFENADLYRRMAGRPYHWLLAVGDQLAEKLSKRLGISVLSSQILIDAPPSSREVEFNLDVYFAKQQQYQNLGLVSPVVRALAQEQFDDYVKQVRFFVDPQLIDQMRQIDDLSGLIEESLEAVGE
ncbi:MAG: HD domain-containing protein [Planctomycetales bacterium]